MDASLNKRIISLYGCGARMRCARSLAIIAWLFQFHSVLCINFLALGKFIMAYQGAQKVQKVMVQPIVSFYMKRVTCFASKSLVQCYVLSALIDKGYFADSPV